MTSNTTSPALGDIVIYFDQDRTPCAAIVVHVHSTTPEESDRPILNLSVFNSRGRFSMAPNIAPAYHDGVRHRLLNRYILKDDPLPDPEDINPAKDTRPPALNSAL